MMRIKENKYQIPINTWDSTVNLIITENISKSKIKLGKRLKLEKEELEEDEDAAAWFITDSLNYGNYYIICPLDIEDYILVHETAHASFKILEDHGVYSSADNDEAFTHLQADIFRQIQLKIKKLKDKQKVTKELEVGKDDSNQDNKERFIL